jgi:hypothetical protein
VGDYAQEVRECLLGPEAKLEPLLDLDWVCQLAKVEVDRCELGAARRGLQAMIAPRDGNRFSLSVDSSPPDGWGVTPAGLRGPVRRHRERFLIAHELAHTLFYDRSADKPQRKVLDSEEQEAWCDRFAQELLLPGEVAGGAHPTPATIVRLAKRYDVSLQMSARALADHHRQSLVALLVERGQRAPHLRVQWHSAQPLGFRWWAADWLQQTLRGSEREGLGTVETTEGPRTVRWQALPGRRQVLLVG